MDLLNVRRKNFGKFFGAQTSWARRWERYLARLPGQRGFYEALFLAGFFLVRPDRVPALTSLGIRHEIFGALRRLLRFSVRPRDFSGPRPEIIFFPHAESPSHYLPIVEVLERLARQGVCSLVWHPSRRTWYFPPPAESRAAETESAFARSLSEPPGGLRTWYQIILSAVQSRWFAARFPPAANDRTWTALLEMHFRSDRAKRILDTWRPGLLLCTHERFSPAAEFLAAAVDRPTIRTAVYHHGIPSAFDHPLVSQDVLVWNCTDQKSLARVDKGSPHYRILGNLELDRWRKTPPRREPPTSEGPSRSVLLFFSQWVGEQDPRLLERVRTALSWMRAVINHRADWELRVKLRNEADPLAAWSELRGWNHGRLSILEGGVSLPESLAGVRAVAGLSSSALYVAAGLGWPVMRLRVPGESEIPVLDEISTPVYLPSELESYLNDLSVGAPSGIRCVPPPECFPEGAADGLFEFCRSQLRPAPLTPRAGAPSNASDAQFSPS